MEESLGQKSPKRLGPSATSGVLTDRISDLPDSIVQHILSFLPAKDAIKFCTLSRQWNSLWKSVPNLLFYCEYGGLEEIDRFVSFVDKTLTMHTSSKISKFLLEFPYNYATEEKAESWISFAKSRAAEELCVNFRRGSYRQNGVLHANCSVMKMSLTSIYFNYYSGVFIVHWTALKVLSLVGTTIDGNTIRSILLGSPLLEFLAIRKCTLTTNGVHVKCVIDVSCANLKELVIDSCICHVCGPVEITGPNLLSLTVVGKMVTETLKFVDVSSLVEATIDFSLDYSTDGKDLAMHKMIQESLLHKLRHVNRFTVGSRALQVVSIRRVEGAFFGSSRCNILKVIMKLNKAYLPGIAALLSSSPDLEQLTIKIIPTIDSEFKLTGLPENDHFPEENYWRSEMGTAKSLFRNLKIVDIVGFIPGSASNLEKVMVELAQFLLASAKVLQKLIIHAEATDGDNKSWTSQPKLLEIFQKLSCCPRASPNAVVILKN